MTDSGMSWSPLRDLGAPPLHLLRPGVLLPAAEPERLRHVAHGGLGPVADDVGDLGRVQPAVLAVDVLDDLLAPIGIEVDVDVGLLLAQAREEPLERQPVEDRVDGRDVEGEAHGRVRGRSAPLAQDAEPPRLLHDVVHDEEVAGEVLQLDHVELLLEPVAHARRDARVLLGGPAPDQLAQPAHGGVALRHLLLRQPRPGAAQREGELVGVLHGALDGAGEAGEAHGHLGAAAQVRAIRRRQPAVHLVEAAPGAHGGEGTRQPVLRRGRVVHGIRRDDGQAGGCREPGELVVDGAVLGVAVVEHLDRHVVVAEQVDQPGELCGGAPPGRSRREPGAPGPCGIR